MVSVCSAVPCGRSWANDHAATLWRSARARPSTEGSASSVAAVEVPPKGSVPRHRLAPLTLLGVVLLAASCGSGGSTLPSTVAQAPGSGVGQAAPTLRLDLSSVSCTLHGPCLAGGSTTGTTGLLRSTSAGASWAQVTAAAVRGVTITALSCVGKTHCMVAGQTPDGSPVVLTTTTAGARFAVAAPPPVIDTPTAVSCPAANDCYAVVDHTLWLTEDFGGSWTQAGLLPSSLAVVGSFACGALGSCVVAGSSPSPTGTNQGAVAVLRPGMAQLASVTLPATTGTLTALWCTSQSTCTALGGASPTSPSITGATARGEVVSLLSKDFGATWTMGGATGLAAASAVTCTSNRACLVVGQGANGAAAAASTSTEGRRWSSISLAYAPTPLEGVACASATSCLAVGGLSLVSIQPA